MKITNATGQSAIQLILVFASCYGCELPTSLGASTGICRYEYDSDFYGGGVEGAKQSIKKWEEEMPFCGMFVAHYYHPCVPKPAYIGPDQNYPGGRFINHTVREKDRWVETTVKKNIQKWIQVEIGNIARNDHQPLGSPTPVRFSNNIACQTAFTQYMCWINFPRCDEFEESLPTCKSSCENLFRVCGYSADFLKCGSADSEKTWVRDIELGENGTLITTNFFPGQPFKANEFLPNSDVPKAVCTPSIQGSSNKVAACGTFIFSLIVLVSISLL